MTQHRDGDGEGGGDNKGGGDDKGGDDMSDGGDGDGKGDGERKHATTSEMVACNGHSDPAKHGGLIHRCFGLK